MKFLIQRILFFIGLAAIIVSCSKDLGNYNYKEINEAVLNGGINKLYTVKKGQILRIKPQLSYSQDPVGDTLNYTYSWLSINQAGFTALRSVLKSDKTIFNVRMNDDLGLYNYVLRITDKRTGVFKEFPFQILISNEVYEGWLLLSETADRQSRLDMLSYNLENQKYLFIEDVLSKVGSDLKLKGTPGFVDFVFTNSLPTNLYGVAVGTSQMATFLGADSLDYRPTYDFSAFMDGGVNLAIGPKSQMQSVDLRAYLWANDNVYAQGTGQLFQVNKMSTGAIGPFRASRHFGYNYSAAVFFNTDASEFVWYPTSSSTNYACQKLENGEALFKNKIDKDLLYMKYVNYSGGEYFAILKDKVGDKVYLARFTLAKQVYFAEITGTPIAQAENFEINNEFGYIFYNVGGKLYEYDFNLKLNKQMQDYGARKISLLKFQEITGSDVERIPRYGDISRRLCVFSYDESDIDHSGAMDIYSIPAINGQLVREDSFTGMGKVVSITYRTR